MFVSLVVFWVFLCLEVCFCGDTDGFVHTYSRGPIVSGKYTVTRTITNYFNDEAEPQVTTVADVDCVCPGLVKRAMEFFLYDFVTVKPEKTMGLLQNYLLYGVDYTKIIDTIGYDLEIHDPNVVEGTGKVKARANCKIKSYKVKSRILSSLGYDSVKALRCLKLKLEGSIKLKTPLHYFVSIVLSCHQLDYTAYTERNGRYELKMGDYGGRIVNEVIFESGAEPSLSTLLDFLDHQGAYKYDGIMQNCQHGACNIDEQLSNENIQDVDAVFAKTQDMKLVKRTVELFRTVCPDGTYSATSSIINGLGNMVMEAATTLIAYLPLIALSAIFSLEQQLDMLEENINYLIE